MNAGTQQLQLCHAPHAEFYVQPDHNNFLVAAEPSQITQPIAAAK